MPLSAIKHVDVDYVRPVAEIPPLLVELVRALPPAVQLAPVPEPSQPPVEPLVADAVEEHAAVQALSDAEASGFVCPECGGSLWETFEGGMVHYHCHVGHVYSADNLLAGQADAVERGLWTAVRALEDRAALSLRIARRLRGGGNDVAARRLEMRSRILEERAALVRLTLEQVLRPEVAQEAETGALNRRSHRRRSAAGRP
jgi:two-component system chemotaxis response regulator CheB